ncbi:MAG: 2TM domain-containing protein [Bacteroidetes bacterium]|nr:2TM domain-containing protein [Bacteroidota bacterium]MBS1757722.1 2TM domain-containing protein [Bacteroidota bacterium]
MEDPQKDEQLWRIAKKRANFQRGLAAYFILNAFLWLIWWFTIGKEGNNSGIPWPLWVTLGWSIGILFHYLNAYGGSKTDLAKKEYDKLINKKQE